MVGIRSIWVAARGAAETEETRARKRPNRPARREGDGGEGRPAVTNHDWERRSAMVSHSQGMRQRRSTAPLCPWGRLVHHVGPDRTHFAHHHRSQFGL